MRFIRNTDLGFRAEDIIRLPLQGVDFNVFRQRIAQEPGIVTVLGMAMVLSQTVRAVRTNPADVIRQE